MVSLFPRSLNTSTDAASSLLSAYPIKLKAVPPVEPKLQGRWYHPIKNAEQVSTCFLCTVVQSHRWKRHHTPLTQTNERQPDRETKAKNFLRKRPPSGDTLETLRA
jgi:hypothetical protein